MDLGGIAARIAGATVSAVGGPIAGTATEALLRELLAVQDRQIELIAELRADVSLLRRGPWATARLHLEQAASPGRTPAEVTEYLTLARNGLFDAIPLQYEQTLDRSQACLDLAMVLRLLGDIPGSRKYAQQAWAELVGATRKECEVVRRMIDPPDATTATATTEIAAITRGLMKRVKLRGNTFYARGWYFTNKSHGLELVPNSEHRMLERGETPQGIFSQHPETQGLVRLWAMAARIQELRRVCVLFGFPDGEAPYQELRVRLEWKPKDISLRARRTPPGTVPQLGDVLRHGDRLLSAASRRGVKAAALVGTVVGSNCMIDDTLAWIQPDSAKDSLSARYGLNCSPVDVGFLVEFGSDQPDTNDKRRVRRLLERDFEDVLETRVYVSEANLGLNSSVQPRISL
jgi:hypothetical protein